MSEELIFETGSGFETLPAVLLKNKSQPVVATNDDNNPANGSPFFKAFAMAACLFFPFGVSFMEMSLWIAGVCEEFVPKYVA